jgi:hypothetical protein
VRLLSSIRGLAIFMMNDLKLKWVESSVNISCTNVVLGKMAELSPFPNDHLINCQLYVKLTESSNTFLSYSQLLGKFPDYINKSMSFCFLLFEMGHWQNTLHSRWRRKTHGWNSPDQNPGPSLSLIPHLPPLLILPK